jgi:hypothetical protein
MMLEMPAGVAGEGPEYLRLDFERLALPEPLRLPDLRHNEVVRLGDFEVAIWLDRIRGVMTVWGPGVRDWYATASLAGDVEDALLLEHQPAAHH